MDAPTPRSGLVLGAQIALALFGFGLLAAWPASAGRMLAVPLDDRAAEALLATISRGDVPGDIRIVGSGPLGGSYVLEGTRADIGGALGDLSVLLVAAPRAGCAATGARS